jgi:hypothetical protein
MLRAHSSAHCVGEFGERDLSVFICTDGRLVPFYDAAPHIIEGALDVLGLCNRRP